MKKKEKTTDETDKKSNAVWKTEIGEKKEKTERHILSGAHG